MSVLELLLLSFGLSMDAFAVAVCKGLSMKKLTAKAAAIIGIWFGGFQALMPTLGYFVASAFSKYISTYSGIIAFALLLLIGLNMIKESFSKDEAEQKCEAALLSIKSMLIMAVATSIDALAVGVTFALLPNINLPFAIISIGVVTFAMSVLGAKIGSVFGAKYKSKAELAGGIILVLLGVKILIEHLCA